MMKLVLMLGGIFIGALVQLFLPPWPVFGGAKPPVLMAFALYCALHRSWRGMWLPVFWAALLHDSLDPGPFGPALLAFPLIAILANRIHTEIFVDGAVTQMICGALGGMLLTGMTVLVFAAGGQRSIHLGHALLRFIGSGLLGAIALPLVSMAISRAEDFIPKRREYGWQ